jgi:predicted permease
MATRLYQLALRAFPRRHRDAYAAEMIDAFEQELASRRNRAARWDVARFVIAACLNAIATGIAERRRHHIVRFGYAFSALDFTLAWRMLLRYPGLSIVSVFGMAVGIMVAAGAFTVMSMLMNTHLPLPEGDRLVSLLNWDVRTNNRELRSLHDYPRWQQLASLEDLGIERTVERNLIAGGRPPEPITVSEISASAFRMVRVEALRGRHLMPEDEQPGAAEAIVIGHREWVRRFDADPDIIGRQVQLGSSTHTVVGVMPEGFAFPVNHGFWIPWRIDPSTYAARTGPGVNVFGKLAAGATIGTARAELTAVGARATADWPATHEHLRPRVMPYTYAFSDMDDPENALSMYAMQLSFVLLLTIVCVNVAILVYARTATRQGEIAVRSALGASRRRIVAQLFVEALAVAGAAAAIGVLLLSVALRQLEANVTTMLDNGLPFWMSMRLTTNTVLYVVVLTLLAAAIIGVIPALKATGRSVLTGLQTLSPGSGSRMQMGRLWTLMIVAQVALTVAVLPAAMYNAWDGLRLRTGDAGFASREFLSTSLAVDRSSVSPAAGDERAFSARFARAHEELDRRLRAEPAVTDVTFSLVGAGQELAMALEVEGERPPGDVDYNFVEGSTIGHLVRFNRVASNFFAAFDVPVIMGRAFAPGDASAGNIIVSRTFADSVFAGANPLGRRVKYVGRSQEADEGHVQLERWYEIVGVVPDFPVGRIDPDPRVYHAAAFGEIYPAVIGVRVRAPDPATFAGALRDVSAALDPNLQLRDIWTNAILVERDQGILRMSGITVALVMLSVIVLSAAGIYALMSFTVARRRREIGIRAALGADRNRLLAGIFSRALGQLAIGAVVGMLGAIGLERLLEGELLAERGAVLLPLVALVMTTVGLLAAVGPARQGLRIQPTEALREE